MMSKEAATVPQKKAITVEIVPCGLRLLVIGITKHDDRQWLMREAPQFGKWVMVLANQYLLVVDAGYDLTEVAAYLRLGECDDEN